MEFSQLDADQTSEQDFRAINELIRAVDAIDRPEWPLPSYEATVGLLRSAVQTGPEPAAFWTARRDGQIVAVSYFELPREENTSTAFISMKVHPGLWRQGIGTAFLRVLCSEAKSAGRTRIMGLPVRVGGSGEQWAERVGFVRTQPYIVQELVVGEVDPGLWDVPTAAGYRLDGWTGPAPEEIIASFARARRAISDAPNGEMTYDDPDWTPERVRMEEAARAEAGAEQRIVIAVHEASGEVAGLTELNVYARQPEHGRQGDTAVLATHRGHGLGRAMKSAMMRRLVVDHPDIERVSTQTAAENAYMAGVNHQIGYRTLWTHVYIEAELEALEKRIG